MKNGETGLFMNLIQTKTHANTHKTSFPHLTVNSNTKEVYTPM